MADLRTLLRAAAVWAALLLASAPAHALLELVDFDDPLDFVDLLIFPGDGVQSALQNVTDGLGNPALLQTSLSQSLTSPGASASLFADASDGRGLVTEVLGASAGESVQAQIELIYPTLGVDLSLHGPDFFVRLEGPPVGTGFGLDVQVSDADGDFASVAMAPQGLDLYTVFRMPSEIGNVDLDRIVSLTLVWPLEAQSPAEVAIESFGFVPEPGTGALLLFGMLALAGGRRAGPRRP